MHGNSRPVLSNQEDVHPRLLELLARHRRSPWRKPLTPYTRASFELVQAQWLQAGRPPLVLDAACGTGWSSLSLARQWKDHLVIGLDQSADRLSRSPQAMSELPRNLLLLRADVPDFWRLLHDAGMPLARHYLLYPNPWPRKQHLQRRWHGHPAFTDLLALGGELECRSNWKVYVDEMALALRAASRAEVEVGPVPDGPALSPFEKKYRASGHALWRCRARLAPLAGVRQQG